MTINIHSGYHLQWPRTYLLIVLATCFLRTGKWADLYSHYSPYIYICTCSCVCAVLVHFVPVCGALWIGSELGWVDKHFFFCVYFGSTFTLLGRISFSRLTLRTQFFFCCVYIRCRCCCCCCAVWPQIVGNSRICSMFNDILCVCGGFTNFRSPCQTISQLSCSVRTQSEH